VWETRDGKGQDDRQDCPATKDAFKKFSTRSPASPRTWVLDDLRAPECRRLDAFNHVCLDYTGTSSPHVRRRSEAEQVLGVAHIVVNKNMNPSDPLEPMTTGRIRIGGATMTTRGTGSHEMCAIGAWIGPRCAGRHPKAVARAWGEVRKLCASFPIYPEPVADRREARYENWGAGKPESWFHAPKGG